MSDDYDDRPLRDRIIGMALEAAKLKGSDKRWAVKALLHERLRTTPKKLEEAREAERKLAERDPVAAARAQSNFDASAVCTDREILWAAYGDPGGREYWTAWLKGVEARLELADLLAAHVAKSEIEYRCIERDLRKALQKTDPSQSSREAIEWLRVSPDTRHLVPESLSETLSDKTKSEISDVRNDEYLTHTGAPGRPTSAHLVEQELNRRAGSGQMLSTMREEAGVLAAWLAATHPDNPVMSPKTIANSLGPKYKKIPKIIPK